MRNSISTILRYVYRHSPFRAAYDWVRDRLVFFRRFPYETISVEVGDHRFSFSTEAAFSRHWFYPRYMDNRIHEPAVTLHMLKRMNRASCFLDVGSCVGYYAILAALHMPDGEVHAIEMDPFLAGEIEKNVGLNDVQNVTVHNLAVGRRAGMLYAVRNRAGSPLRHVHLEPPPARWFSGVRAQQIPVVSLDEMVTRPVDLAKIDVEGAEYEVLKGMERILREDRPLLYVEVHPGGVERFGSEMNDILAFLHDLSYSVFEIDDFRSAAIATEMEPVADLSHLREATMLYCEWNPQTA